MDKRTSVSFERKDSVTVIGNPTLLGLSIDLNNVTIDAQDTLGNIVSLIIISITIVKPESESFPVVPDTAAFVVAIALVVVAGLVVYHKKLKKDLVNNS
jgi:hypothetical protein